MVLQFIRIHQYLSPSDQFSLEKKGCQQKLLKPLIQNNALLSAVNLNAEHVAKTFGKILLNTGIVFGVSLSSIFN